MRDEDSGATTVYEQEVLQMIELGTQTLVSEIAKAQGVDGTRWS